VCFQTPEFKALMDRLRREEESRAYERMMAPHPRLETFAQRYPNAPSASREHGPALSMAGAFAEINRPHTKEDEGSEGLDFKELNRHLMVVFNVLVSIFGVAATVWFAARWRDTTERLLLTLLAALTVAVADAVLYSGVLVDLMGKPTPKKKEAEVREVVHTWVMGDEDEERDGVVIEDEAKDAEASALRRRHKPPLEA
jgi:TMEM199 family protein